MYMVFCNKCGREIAEGVDICPSCGKSQRIETEEDKRKAEVKSRQAINDELFYDTPTKPIATRPINNNLLFALIIGGAALVVGGIILIVVLT